MGATPQSRGEFDPGLESALASVPRPCAQAAFKAELRTRFLAEESTTASATASREFGSLRDPAPFADPHAARRRTFLRVGSLLAAGLILAVGFFLLESAAPRWKVLDLAADSVVRIDGEAAATSDRAALARALQRGREIEVVQGDLVLQIEDLSLFDVSQGTRVAFEGFDRRSAGAPYVLRVPAGRLRAVTGPGFHGHTMKVNADLIDATVVGTAFAVDYEPHGTCVCCLHGEVAVSAAAIPDSPRKIEPAQMCLIYREAGHEPKWGGSPEKHAVPLRELEQRAREIWP